MTEGIEAAGLVRQLNDTELSPQRREIQEKGGEQSFADVLSNAINDVDETMKDSNQKVRDFIAGDTNNVHDVMISMQRAQLSFEMMVEVRNKAIEAYQEVSRMQI